MYWCAVFAVQNVGMNTARKIVQSSTDATVERLLTQCLIHGSYHTLVAKNVVVHWGRTVAIHAISCVTQVTDVISLILVYLLILVIFVDHW